MPTSPLPTGSGHVAPATPAAGRPAGLDAAGAIALAVLLAALVLVLATALSSPLKDDVAWLLYVARKWLGGQRLYVDLVEVNPPLIVRDIFNIITQLRASGVTILLVEQNARAALEVADHGYVLETGDLVLQGPAGDLAEDPRVIETYLGAKKERPG